MMLTGALVYPNEKRKEFIMQIFFLIVTIRSLSEVWIGQNDLAVEHVWKYVNPPPDCETTGVYLNWESGQPNSYSGDQDCVAFIVNNNNFHGKNCAEEYMYYTVCETIEETGKL